MHCICFVYPRQPVSCHRALTSCHAVPAALGRYTYGGLVRVYKHIDFALRDPDVRLSGMSFSSYPGEVRRGDSSLLRAGTNVVACCSGCYPTYVRCCLSLPFEEANRSFTYLKEHLSAWAIACISMAGGPSGQRHS